MRLLAKVENNHRRLVNSFFALVRAGLWEQSVRLLEYAPIDFEAVYDLADQQSVVGLIAAGLEYVEDRKVVKKEALPFLKKVFGLESRNSSMNAFIGDIVSRMRDEDILPVLIKGQGVAQCYVRPLWRSSGDVDFFLDNENYVKAKAFLMPIAEHVEGEDASRLHLGMTIDSWTVELHGTLHIGISARVDRGLDVVQREVFRNGSMRVWRNGDIGITLPNPNDDAIIIFTHFIKHFYVGGIGLRQICDWCRLLWTYKDTVDRELLEDRLRKMSLMKEWKAFATLAVEWLGMPGEAMPFYSVDNRFTRKAEQIHNLILVTGNMGHNKDESYRSRYPKLVGNVITFWRRLGEFARLSTIFPENAPRFFVTYVLRRTSAVL